MLVLGASPPLVVTLRLVVTDFILLIRHITLES